MEIKLQVDETQFKDILDMELKNLPQEKIQEIILEGIREYLHNTDVIKNLFTEQRYSYWSPEPSTYLKAIISKSIPEDGFADIRDELLATLKSNYNEILIKAMTELIVQGLCNSGSLQSTIADTLYSIRCSEANNSSY